MPKKGAPKGAGQAISQDAIRKAGNNLSGKQVYKLSKTAIKQEGKTARMAETGKTRRTAARSTAGAASVSTTAANADLDTGGSRSSDTKKAYDSHTGQYDGLAMGGIGTTDDPEQVMSSGTAEDGPGRTKVWQ